MSHTLSPPASSWHKAIVLLILAGLCAYCNSFTKAFVLDDHKWITEDFNPSKVEEFLKNDLTMTRPVISLSLIANAAVQDAFAGGSGSAGHHELGYHVLNLVIHLLAGLTLFGLVRRTLLLERWREPYRASADWLAFAVALLWMIHPLQTQSVTYVIQRCESLMGLFLLLGCYCSIRAWDAPRRWPWYLTSMFCFALSAGCKEVAAAAPVLVPLYDWTVRRGWPLLRRHKEIMLGVPLSRILFYLGVALATWGVLAGERYLQALAYKDTQLNFGLKSVSRIDYLRTEAGVVVYYLKICFWTPDLCFDWKGWPLAVERQDWLPQSIALGVLALLTFVGVLLRCWWGFAGAWFFLVLAPTSTIIPIDDVAFDHRMYLPLASVVLLVVVIGYALLRRLGSLCAWSEKGIARIAIGCLLLLSGTLIVLTILRNEDYRTAEILYVDTVRKNPLCAREFYNLSLEQSSADDLRPAIESCDRALGFHPDDGASLRHRARLAFTAGDFPAVVSHFERAHKDASQHRAGEFCLLAQSYRALGDRPKAIEKLRLAIEKAPGEAEYRLELAVVLDELGQKEEADTKVQEALQRSSRLLETVHRTARRNALAQPRPDRAFASLALFQAKQAVLGEGDNPLYLDTLAIAEAANGNFSQAVKTARRALGLAREKQQRELAKGIERRIALFERGQPYRLETARPE